ncbi:MAG: radical SAM protein [Treponemataceae bacterium]|nr:radical SAM protein [Treponemataceae bacterium]
MPCNNLYEKCVLCPRNCGVDRTSGIGVASEADVSAHKYGFCGESAEIRAASACLHFGEEPPITVNGGSGTIFITGCNLRCAFCQNYQISQCGMGASLSAADFADICLKLQAAGAENINIVTGSHDIPAIAEALSLAKSHGLTLPICWNCSAYETVEALEMLKGLVDIWLPDLKTLNPLIADAVFKARDYPAVAKKAIRWMVQNTSAEFRPAPNGKEKMMSGVIIRHLVLPGRLDDTRLTLDWLKKTADRDDDHCACVSLMSQYTPVVPEEGAFSQSQLTVREAALGAFSNRLISKDEFAQIRAIIDEYDFQYLFYQELEEDTEWLPDFNRTQPFSNKLAKPVWHWKNSFLC